MRGKGRYTAINKNKYNYLKFITLALALPFIYGCGDAGTLGFLFGSGGGIGPIASLDPFIGGGGSAATLVNPEPASMILLGSGLMAMGYFKSKTDRKNK